MSDFSDADFDRLIDGNTTSTAANPLDASWIAETLADAYAWDQPIDWTVHKFLARPSLSIVYGPPGGYKSMILADLAVCVAAGKVWLDAMPENTLKPGRSYLTTQSPVLWLDFDNGRRRSRERFAAFGRGHNVGPDIPLQYVSMPNPWLQADKPTDINHLSDWAKRRQFRLIIIDNLGLITGDTEENKAGMAFVMGRLRWLAEDTEAAVVVVHHQRKGEAGNTGRKGESLRGHSSIEAAIDLALLVERNGQATEAAIVPTKIRDFGDFGTLGAFFTYEHYGTDDSRLRTARFWSKYVESSDEVLNVAIRSYVKEALREARKALPQKALVDAVRDAMAALPGSKTGPGTNKVRGVIKAMVKDGHLLEEGAGNNLSYRLI